MTIDENREAGRRFEIRFERELQRQIPHNYERQQAYGDVRPDFVLQNDAGEALALIENKAGPNLSLAKEEANMQLAATMKQKAMHMVFEGECPPQTRAALQQRAQNAGLAQFQIHENVNTQAAYARTVRAIWSSISPDRGAPPVRFGPTRMR